jgi:O-antigen ligase
MLVGVGALIAFQPAASLFLGAGIPLGLALFVWPELTLVLYVNAGLFKADPRLSSLSSLFDLTLALAALLAASVAYRVVWRRERITWVREMSLVLAFAGLILIRLLYTPAGSYATEKAFRFVSLTLLAFFTPLVIIKSYRSIWIFMMGWVGFAALLAIEAVGQLSTGQRLSAFNATPIALSRALGVGIIILLFAVLMGQLSRRWKLLAAAAVVVMFVALVGSGARGPLLMLVVTLVFTLGLSIVRGGRRLQSLLVMGAFGIAVVSILGLNLIPAVSLQRFTVLVDQTGVDTSSQARLMVMQVAWELFTTSPLFGRGTGSVSAFGAGRELSYPHNVLLELAAETGLVGLGLYLALVGLVLWRLISRVNRRAKHGPLWLALIAMLVYTFLNAMVSGDLSDNRDFWLFAGIAIAATQIEAEGEG